jgi:hypothetical protein
MQLPLCYSEQFEEFLWQNLRVLRMAVKEVGLSFAELWIQHATYSSYHLVPKFAAMHG